MTSHKRENPTKCLARCFGTSERFWLNLQAQYDLDVERDRLGDRLDREVTPRAPSDAAHGTTRDTERALGEDGEGYR